MIFTNQDLNYWLSINKESWEIDYWNNHKPDLKHFDVWKNFKFGKNIKILYDSYTWKKVISKQLKQLDKIKTLELLPGNSLTIPLALESLNFKSELYRLDENPLLIDGKKFSFTINDIKIDIFNRNISFSGYELIVGNHILDDLLFFLFLKERNISIDLQSNQYINPTLNSSLWQEIKKCKILNQYFSTIFNVFHRIIDSLDVGSFVILKQYPSTFSLRNKDLTQINLQLKLYKTLIENSMKQEKVEIKYANLDDIDVPIASKFIHSFVIIKKVSA